MVWRNQGDTEYTAAPAHESYSAALSEKEIGTSLSSQPVGSSPNGSGQRKPGRDRRI